MKLFSFFKKQPVKIGTNYNEITCGGKISNKNYTSPLTNIDGRICEFSIVNHSAVSATRQNYSFILRDHSLKASFSDPGKGSYCTEISLSNDEIKQIDQLIKESGINNLNGWCVKTAGLPPEGDGEVSINYTSGESLYISFNGCNAPEGYKDCCEKIYSQLVKLVDYTYDKLTKPAPRISPLAGEHHFIYTDKKGRVEKYVLNAVQKTNGFIISLSAKGFAGDFTAELSGTRVYTKNREETFFLSKIRDISGSPDKKYGSGDLLGQLIDRYEDGIFLKLIKLAPKGCEVDTELKSE